MELDTSRQLGVKGQPGQRGIPAKAAAHDGDSLRVGNTPFYCPLDGVHLVFDNLAAPFSVTGIGEGFAQAG